jgi:hypothetical protein
MGKTKTAEGAKIAEGKLLKALTELEESVTKGDALEDADPEGGLSTEGEPLSDAAPRGRGETKKSRRSSSGSASTPDEASSDDSSSDDDDSSVSEMMSSKSSKKKKKGKSIFPPEKTKKSVSKAERSSDDDDDASSDDSSSGTKKSFRQMAEGDETMRKAIVVNDFIEAMVDQLSLALHHVQESMSKSIKGMEKRLSAHIDDRVAKSSASQQGFNARLAKAVAAIGNTVQDDLLGMVDMVKSMTNQPVTAPRGKAVLSKGEVNQPPWSGPRLVNADQRLADGADDYAAGLSELSPEAIGEWLFRKSAANQIDPKLIMAWEADRYNIEALPVQVRKAIVNDLCK